MKEQIESIKEKALQKISEAKDMQTLKRITSKIRKRKN